MKFIVTLSCFLFALTIGQPVYTSDPFRLQIDVESSKTLEKELNGGNPIVSIPEGPLPIYVDPNGILTIKITDSQAKSIGSTFRITEKGALVVHNEDAVSAQKVGDGDGQQVIPENISISAKSLLNFDGLDNWTVNWNGPNLNINLPGSRVSGSSIPLTATSP